MNSIEYCSYYAEGMARMTCGEKELSIFMTSLLILFAVVLISRKYYLEMKEK